MTERPLILVMCMMPISAIALCWVWMPILPALFSSLLLLFWIAWSLGQSMWEE